MADTSDRLAGSWNLTPVHSSVDFSVKSSVVRFRAGFDEIEAKLEDGKLSGSGKASSISVKSGDFHGHLQTDEFLAAENNPEIKFEADSIDVNGDDVTVEGTLTLAGKTQPLRATGTIAGPVEGGYGPQLGLSLEATFDRTAFGIEYNTELPDGSKSLSNDVTVTAELEFAKAE